jgi:hypothetical protein
MFCGEIQQMTMELLSFRVRLPDTNGAPFRPLGATNGESLLPLLLLSGEPPQAAVR